MIKTAILVDGGWMTKLLKIKLKKKFVTAEQVYNNAISVLQDDECLYRLFYYDAAPYDQKQTNPLSQSVKDFSKTPAYNGGQRFLKELNERPQVALRLGSLKFRGWQLQETFHKKLLNNQTSTSSISQNDIAPVFMQKGVDMKIGIDIASLVFKKQVSRIILFSGDTDMIPAMKLARMEGTQIVIMKIGNSISSELIADSDFVRTLNVIP